MDATAEHQRLAALRAYNVLDTLEEASFDEIAQAVAKFCDAPIAAVSLVDEARQWFKAKVGLDVRETSRDVSFCSHAMHGSDVYVVTDAQSDPLFADNPLVTGGPNIRFYAGAPIRTPDGMPLGALCVIDTRARPEGLTEAQSMVLSVLAKQVEAQLRLRLALQRQAGAASSMVAAMTSAARREERLVSALESAEVGWWDWELGDDLIFGNKGLAAAYGLPEATVKAGLPLATFLSNIHPADRAWVRDAIVDAVKTGAPFRAEYQLAVAGGGYNWISARGQCLRNEAGEPWRFPGVLIDVTDKKRTEERLREADVGRELAMEAAQLGRFDHNPSKGERFYDRRALEMVGLTAEEVKDLPLVLSHVHPEDRESLRLAVAKALDPRRTGPLNQTYRLTRPRTGEQRWMRVVGKSQFTDGVCTRFMGVLEDVTEAKQMEEHRRLLTTELNHRMKNTLAIALSLVDSSLRNVSDPAAVRADIGGRIQALSRANDLLTAENWSAASTSQIVYSVVNTMSLPAHRVELSGGAVQLGPGPALQLALALHELATNAIKYGALSNETGTLSMCWAIESLDGRQTFVFDWSERGGPPVTAPARSGFGTRLIQRATAAAFDGDVDLQYLSTGLRWSLRAPYAGLSERGRSGV